MPSSPSSFSASWRVKELRLQRGWTLEELAALTGMTKSYLSKVERGASTPSIATALKLARAFGMEVGAIFGSPAAQRDYVLVKRAQRTALGPQDGTGSFYESLSPGLPGGDLEVFVARPATAGEARKPAEHGGQELLFVLRGRMCVEFPEAEVEMEAGDCLQFLAHLPHRLRSLGKQPAEVLIVVSPRAAGASGKDRETAQ